MADKCGNLYVSGDYTKSMTIAADNDIIIRPWMNTLQQRRPNGIGNAVMGLIAQNFVRVYHPCSPENGSSSLMKNVTIDAAILSLLHSFTADNHDCGSQLDKLTVIGAIAQKYRGRGRHHRRHRLQEGLQLRRPAPLPQPAVLPRPDRRQLARVRSNEQVPPR